MASAQHIWLQGVASVLSFTPPGLLLVATGLQLRQIPVDRTSLMLRTHRIRISMATGSQSLPESGADQGPSSPGSRFLSRLRDAIERSCRRGENPLPSIVALEQLTSQTREHLQRSFQQLAGLSARTALALVFTESICLLIRLILPSGPADPRAIWVGAGAAGCIATCGCLLPLHQIRRAIEQLDFSDGRTASIWIDSLSPAGKNTRLGKYGITLADDESRWLRDEFNDRAIVATRSIARAERMSVIYEIVALLPASALLVISRA